MNQSLGRPPKLTSIGCLNESEAQAFFAPALNEPVPLRKLPSAKIIWLNRRLMVSDMANRQREFGTEEYEQRILENAAFIADAEGSDAVGVADRYGGIGIGHNGGSGRAIFVNGFHIKGVGPTPLVRSEAEADHSSGHLYLEEAAREALFSELFSMELPHGAVGTIAIIDTGLTALEGDRLRRRVLLVRQAFLRPAHFERAVYFRSARPKVGVVDRARVARNIAMLADGRSASDLVTICVDFFRQWSEQVAYSFVHRLAQCGDCTSNIAFDGALVDFGAATAVPSWARSITSLDGRRFGQEIEFISGAIESICYYLNKHAYLPTSTSEQCAKAVVTAYRSRTRLELFRLCGGDSRNTELLWLVFDDARFLRLMRDIVTRAQGEQIDWSERFQAAEQGWNFSDLWLSQPPNQLKPLSEFLADIVPAQSRARWAARCRFLACPRTNLYRDNLWNEFSAKEVAWGKTIDREELEDCIASELGKGRRDSNHTPVSSVICGFAVSANFSCVIYRRTNSDVIFARFEWSVPQGTALEIKVGSSAPFGEFQVLGYNSRRLEIKTEGRMVSLRCHVYIDDHVLRSYSPPH